jgi:hypothetical protein
MAEPRDQRMNLMTDMNSAKRKANRRLALVLGVVALGFYLLMLLYNR